MTDGYKIKRVLIWQGGEEKQIYPKKINPYDLLTDVIVYYPMQGNLNDAGPNGWNLIDNNGSYSGTDYIVCTNLRAYNGNATYSTSGSATITAWMNPSSAVCRPLCLGDDYFNSQYGWWGMFIDGNKVIVVIGGSGYATDNYTFSNGWHMYTGVFDYTNHTIKFYVDGVEVKSKSVASGGLRGGNGVVLGGAIRSGTDSLYSGDLGITFATQNAMTQAQIQEFYNASKSLYGL